MPDDDPATTEDPSTENPSTEDPSTDDPQTETPTENTTEDEEVTDPVVTVVRPQIGGGLGDMKVMFLSVSGTKPEGGFAYKFKSTPIFICADNGAVSYDATNGKIDCTTGATIMAVFKG